MSRRPGKHLRTVGLQLDAMCSTTVIVSLCCQLRLILNVSADLMHLCECYSDFVVT